MKGAAINAACLFLSGPSSPTSGLRDGRVPAGPGRTARNPHERSYGCAVRSLRRHPSLSPRWEALRRAGARITGGSREHRRAITWDVINWQYLSQIKSEVQTANRTNHKYSRIPVSAGPGWSNVIHRSVYSDHGGGLNAHRASARSAPPPQ